RAGASVRDEEPSVVCTAVMITTVMLMVKRVVDEAEPPAPSIPHARRGLEPSCAAAAGRRWPTDQGPSPPRRTPQSSPLSSLVAAAHRDRGGPRRSAPPTRS